MSLMDSIIAFINKYYIDPIVNDSGYNIVNTATWAIVLGIAVYLLIYAFKKMNIKIDEKFMMATFPFVIAGASLRVVADMGVVSPPYSFILITPNIYFFVFFIAAACLGLLLLLQKFNLIKSFHLPFAICGGLFTVLIYIVLFSAGTVVNWWVPFASAIIGIGIAAVFWLIAKKAGSRIFTNKMNLAILAAHMIDAASTVIGMEVFGYYEKHVIPAYLIDVTGTALIMFPLKLILFFVIVWALDVVLEKSMAKESDKDKEEMGQIKNAIKYVVFILGLAPGIRNSIRLFFGV